MSISTLRVSGTGRTLKKLVLQYIGEHGFITRTTYTELTGKPAEELEEITKNYITKDYIIDQKYRYFYYHYDNVPDSSIYENLRELVENVYTNRFLNPLAVAFSRLYVKTRAKISLTSQQDFIVDL